MNDRPDIQIRYRQYTQNLLDNLKRDVIANLYKSSVHDAQSFLFVWSDRRI